MISIDRTSATPVADQLADQLRFHIASGRYAEGTVLPSTRALGRQVGVSFHTVRKVYQQLAEERLLDSRPGSGYVVIRRAPSSKEERMERGAAIASEALLRLSSLGLSDSEITYLFDEQRALLESDTAPPKVVFAAPSEEMAIRCADQIAERMQIDAEACAIDELPRHADADYVVVPYANVSTTMTIAADSDVIGVEISLGTELLDVVSRLTPTGTLGLLVGAPDTVQPVVSGIREATGFQGHIVAMSIDDGTIELLRRLKDCEAVAVSPGVRRRVPGTLRKEKRIVTIDGRITEESVARLRALLPS